MNGFKLFIYLENGGLMTNVGLNIYYFDIYCYIIIMLKKLFEWMLLSRCTGSN